MQVYKKPDIRNGELEKAQEVLKKVVRSGDESGRMLRDTKL